MFFNKDNAASHVSGSLRLSTNSVDLVIILDVYASQFRTGLPAMLPAGGAIVLMYELRLRQADEVLKQVSRSLRAGLQV